MINNTSTTSTAISISTTSAAISISTSMTTATLRDIPMDVFKYVIFPQLDQLSLFCVQIVLRHKRIPNKQYFLERIHELIVQGGFDYYCWFNNYGSLDHTVSMNYAAKYSQLRILAHGHKNNYIFAIKAMNNAAEYGVLDCVKLLHKCQLRYTEQTLEASIRGDQLNIMEYLISRGCKLSDNARVIAARNGSLECLKYVTSKNGIAYRDSYITAAVNGHLNIIQYLQKYHKTIDNYFYEQVISANQAEMLSYLLMNYRHDNSLYLIVCKHNKFDMLQILLEQGMILTSNIKTQCLTYNLTSQVQEWLLIH